MFLEEYESRSGSNAYYAERSKIWLEKLPADRPVQQITAADIERFRNVRGRKVSASTVRKDLVALSTLFRWAMARRLIADNPADPSLVRRPPEPRHDRGYLTKDEEEALLAACADWLRPVVEWCLATGMDREEVLELSWRQVDEEAGYISAPRRKTGVARMIPLTGDVKAILERAKKLRTVTGGLQVFLGPDGRRIHREAAKTALRRAYTAAGLEVRGQWKILRHTLASRLAMAGVTAAAIARLLGHTTQEITDRYMHLSPSYLAEAREALNTAPSGQRSSDARPTRAAKQEKSRK